MSTIKNRPSEILKFEKLLMTSDFALIRENPFTAFIKNHYCILLNRERECRKSELNKSDKGNEGSISVQLELERMDSILRDSIFIAPDYRNEYMVYRKFLQGLKKKKEWLIPSMKVVVYRNESTFDIAITGIVIPLEFLDKNPRFDGDRFKSLNLGLNLESYSSILDKFNYATGQWEYYPVYIERLTCFFSWEDEIPVVSALNREGGLACCFNVADFKKSYKEGYNEGKIDFNRNYLPGIIDYQKQLLHLYNDKEFKVFTTAMKGIKNISGFDLKKGYSPVIIKQAGYWSAIRKEIEDLAKSLDIELTGRISDKVIENKRDVIVDTPSIISAKFYALAYLLELECFGQPLPLKSAEGSLDKQTLMGIGLERMGSLTKDGQGFYNEVRELRKCLGGSKCLDVRMGKGVWRNQVLKITTHPKKVKALIEGKYS